MKNTIAERIQDFLKQFPPFDLLSPKELRIVSEQVRVLYIEKGVTVFEQDDACKNEFYIVREGVIRLHRNTNEAEHLVDMCDIGDMFGLRIMIIKKNYRMTATANEESIVYAISTEVFEPILDNNKKVNNYLLASFAAHARHHFTENDQGEKISNTISSTIAKDVSQLHLASYQKEPLHCTPDQSIKAIARMMTEKKVDYCVLCDQDNRPIGIITDKDLRTKIATGIIAIESPSTSIMSSPVITYTKNVSIVEAQMLLIKKGINHLCITADGTHHSSLIGMLSDHDLFVSYGNNPAAIIEETHRIQDIQELSILRKQVNILLKDYLDHDVPIRHVSNIISEINEAITIRVIEISIKEMPSPPPVAFGWMTLGSQGRREQLLITDQDNAIVFEDVAENQYETVQAYFLDLASKVTTGLHKIGYDYCPAEMMASNPRWCLSLTEWKTQFRHWMTTPNAEGTLLSSIFFDFQHTYGNLQMVDALSKTVFEGVNKTKRFLILLGVNALQKPSPLSFFKQFLVEQNGEHKDNFDIKTRAMMVLIDAARILILAHNIKGVNNTTSRYARLAIQEPKNKELFNACAHAFNILLKFRAKQGLMHHNSGRYIKLGNLSKVDKLELKRCFKPIRDIQELLRIRYQLDIFL